MKKILIITVVSLSIISCKPISRNKTTETNNLPTKISFESKGLFPEGISYDKNSKSFYVSSVGTGNITKISLNGSCTPFISDDSFVSTMGMRIIDNKLLVCNSDFGIGQKTSKKTMLSLANFSIWDMKSKKKLHNIDFSNLVSGFHLVNDITYDINGNMYITDSFSSSIYKVTPKGEISILLSDKRFAVKEEGKSGLNGIVYHPNGYLIVSKYSEGALFKIPLSNPNNFTEINIENDFSNIDGMLLKDNENLVFVTNDLMTGDGTIHQIKSNDSWRSASTVGIYKTGNVSPTTLTLAEGKIYALYSKLHLAFSPENTNRNEYLIQQITF